MKKFAVKSPKRDKRMFSKTAQKFDNRNMSGLGMRGGIRF